MPLHIFVTVKFFTCIAYIFFGMSKKIKIFSNVFLSLILVAVFSVSFFPLGAVTTSVRPDDSPYYYGDRTGKGVSLMFNVYENAEVVRGIADLLFKNGVKATFFLGGCWADDNEETIRYLLEKGEEIANHGYFHRDHAKLGAEGNKSEIESTEKIINALSGVKTTLFAPPSGSFSKTTLDVAKELGYKVIMWSLDTIDWRDNNEELIIKRATGKVKGGDLILMHPKPHTLSALQRIIDAIKGKGLTIVTVSENLGN